MKRRNLAFMMGFSGVVLTVAGTLAAAPGVYPTEFGPSAIPLADVVLPQATESPFRLEGGISVVQTVADKPVTVPICVDGKSIGHAYAVPFAPSFRMICRSATGSTQTPPVGLLVKPTRPQASSVYWVPFQKGAALPRQIAPLAIDGNGAALYACKAKLGNNEFAGTLLPNGECQLAPLLRGQAGGRVESSSMVLVRAGSQGASPAPSYGWIYLKAGPPGVHHPGGTLLRWYTTASTFCQGKMGAATLPGVLETNPDGSVRGCAVSYPGGTTTTSEGVVVFRNDAGSNVEFASNVPATVPRVSIGGRVPCVLETPSTTKKLHFGTMEGGRCKTTTYLQLAQEFLPFYELVRRGAWPDQG